jgi:hypothetical protein
MLRELKLRYFRWRLSVADKSQWALIESCAVMREPNRFAFTLGSNRKARRYLRNQKASAKWAGKIAKTSNSK